jgi:hypothetical protein
MSAKIATLRAASAHRRGLYADGYRIGLDVADGIITPAQDVNAHGKQWATGYRDGLALRPVRVPVKGKGSASRQNSRALRYWRRKQNPPDKILG